MRSVARDLRTLRHARAPQVVGRVIAPLRRRLTTLRLPARCADGAQPLRPAPFPCHDPWNNGNRLRDGEFRFLNRTVRLSWPPDWQAPGEPLLWRFNLHYFQYLHLLDSESRTLLLHDWIDAVRSGDPVAWHPYPLSRRAVSWARAGSFDSRVLHSLYQQTAYLNRNIEWHVLGNHLLENARALVVAGSLFGGDGRAARWVAQGLEILRQQSEEQVLKDGAHFERSPMYHALALEAYLDVLNALPDTHPDRDWLSDLAQRMSRFLASVAHPDGGLPLFNDSTLEVAPPVQHLLAYAEDVLGREIPKADAFPEAGYFIADGGDASLMIDGGPMGPDHLLAHAHADTFSYELSIRGRRVVVDTGVFGYEPGPLRDYVRSTRAHNTVSVDRVDQAECWHSFRVGRRFTPRDVRFSKNGGTCAFEGWFDGYARLIGDGIRHGRRLVCDATGRKIEVRDRVEGRGAHLVESFVHLHPAVTVEGRGRALEFRRDGVRATLEVASGQWDLEESIYCPEFGRRDRRVTIVISSRDPLPAEISYAIRY